MAKPWEQEYAAPPPAAGVESGPASNARAKPWEQNYGGQGWGTFIDNVVRQIARGLTFGFADELAAGLNAALGVGQGETFRDRFAGNVAGERARDAAFEQSNPVAAVGGQVVGGLLNPAVRAVGGATTLGRMASGAASGGIAGGISGFGEAQGGVAERLPGAMAGAGFGAAVGAAVPLAANVVSRVGGRALDAVGLRNPNVAGQRQVLRAIERDAAADPSMGLGQIAARARAPQGPGAPPMALVDQGGENLVQLGATAVQQPGAAAQAARQLVGSRAGEQQSGRLVDAVRRFVSGESFHDTLNDLITARSRAAAPKYEAAFSRIQVTPQETARVARFFNDPIGQDAVQRGLRILQLEALEAGAQFNPAAHGVRMVNGRWEPIADTYSLRLMDAVKRGFDDIVEGFRDPTTLRLNLNEYGRAVNNVRARYVGELRSMFPRYAAALDAWAGPSRAIDALRAGREILRPDAEVTSGMLRRMTSDEQSFFRIGAARALADRILSVADNQDVSAIRRIWGSQMVRDRISAAFPNARDAQEFRRVIDNELRVAATNREIGPRAGSQTARRLAGQSDMQNDPAGGLVSTLLRGAQHGGFGGAVAAAAERAYRTQQPMNASTADALGPLLFRADGGRQAVQELLRRRMIDEARASVARRGMSGAVTGSAVATGLGTN